MEIYMLFNVFTAVVMIAGMQTPTALFYGLGIAFVAWIALFVLQGIGVYQMAKNRDLKKKWLAFVPFANLFYLEKLTGPCSVFGQRVKHMGLYTMIAQIIATILCFLTIAAHIFLYVECGMPQFDQYGTPQWSGLVGFALTCYKFYNISSYILSIVQLVYEILTFVLCLALYKKYVPKNYFGLGMLTLFVPLSRFIIIFAIRNRKAIDFEAYMRARQEAYMRNRQQYGGYGGFGPYGNSYGNPYNQGRNPYNSPDTQPKPPEEPFAEFGGRKTEETQRGNNGNAFEDKEKNESPFDDFA